MRGRSPLGNPLLWIVAAFVVPEVVKKCKPLAKVVGDALVGAGEAFRRAAVVVEEPVTVPVEEPTAEPVAEVEVVAEPVEVTPEPVVSDPEPSAEFEPTEPFIPHPDAGPEPA